MCVYIYICIYIYTYHMQLNSIEYSSQIQFESTNKPRKTRCFSSKLHLHPTFFRGPQSLHGPTPPALGAPGAAPGNVAAEHQVLREQRTAELGGHSQNQGPPAGIVGDFLVTLW